MLKTIRKRRASKIQIKQKQGNKKVKAAINKIANRKTIEKLMKLRDYSSKCFVVW